MMMRIIMVSGFGFKIPNCTVKIAVNLTVIYWPEFKTFAAKYYNIV